MRVPLHCSTRRQLCLQVWIRSCVTGMKATLGVVRPSGVDAASNSPESGSGTGHVHRATPGLGLIDLGDTHPVGLRACQSINVAKG